jgi:sugar phosphate isomerase/epimerase
MKIGGMNHPGRDPIEEIRWYGEHDFDFVDFTLEPPCADPDEIDPGAIRTALQEYNLDVIAHCAWFIPISSPFAGIRQAALEELRRSLRAARAIGATLMTTHYYGVPHIIKNKMAIDWHVEVLAPLCQEAAEIGITIAIENIPNQSNHQVKHIGSILRAIPSLRFHLDSAHAKLEGNYNHFDSYLSKLGSKMVHVHLSENDGSGDQHLPLGGSARNRTDWPKLIRKLKQSGYDGTISLEVFTEQREYLLLSRKLLREWWSMA